MKAPWSEQMMKAASKYQKPFFSSLLSFLFFLLSLSCWLPLHPLRFWLLFFCFFSFLFYSFFFFFFLAPTPQNLPQLLMFYGKVEKWVTFVGVWGTLCPPLFFLFFILFIYLFYLLFILFIYFVFFLFFLFL